VTLEASNSVSSLTRFKQIEVQPVLTSSIAVNVRFPCASSSSSTAPSSTAATTAPSGTMSTTAAVATTVAPSPCTANTYFRHLTTYTFEITAFALRAEASLYPGHLQVFSAPSALSSTTFTFSLTANVLGSFDATFRLSNNVSSVLLTYHYVVEPTLEVVSIAPMLPALIGTTVTFHADVLASGSPAGTPMVWTFGDGASTTVYNSFSVSHVFNSVGVYTVYTTAYNELGSITSSTSIIAQSSVCLPPAVTIGEIGAAFKYARSDEFRIRASVVYNCSNFTSLDLSWSVYHFSTNPNTIQQIAGMPVDVSTLPVVMQASGSAIEIQSYDLPLGAFVFKLTATLTGSYPLISSSEFAAVAIMSSPAIAKLNNSADSTLAWYRENVLILDASDSQDPDVGPDAGANLMYNWQCQSYAMPTNCSQAAITASAASCFVSNFVFNTSAVITLAPSLFRTDRTMFVFSVSVRRPGAPVCASGGCLARALVRSYNSALMRLRITGTDGTVNAYDKTSLTVSCLTCASNAVLTYAWSFDTSDCAAAPVGLSSLALLSTTGASSSVLVLPAQSLNQSVRIAVTVTDSQGRRGYASIALSLRTPPSDGSCIALDSFGSPISSGVELNTLFTITCTNWSSSSNPRGSLSNSPGLLFSFFLSGSDDESRRKLGGGPDVNSVSKYLPRGHLTITVTIATQNGATTTVSLSLVVAAASTAWTDAQNLASTMLSGRYRQLALSGDTDGQRALATSICSTLNAIPLTNKDATLRAERVSLRSQILNDLNNGTTTSDQLASDSSVLVSALGGSDPSVIDADGSLLLKGARVLKGLARGAKDTTADDDDVFENLLQASVNMMTAVRSVFSITPTDAASIAQLVARSSETLASAILANVLAEEPAYEYEASGVSFRFARESANVSSVSHGDSEFQLSSSALALFNSSFISNMQVYDSNPYATNSTSIQSSVVSLVLQASISGEAVVVENLAEPILIRIPMADAVSAPAVSSVAGGTTGRHRVTHSASCSDCATHIVIQPLTGPVSFNVTVFSDSTNTTGAQLSIAAVWDEDDPQYFTILIPPPSSTLSLSSYYAATDSVASAQSGAIGFGAAGNYTVLIVNNNSTANISYRFLAFQTECSYWNETNSSWATNGCTASAFTTVDRLACRCNHLTSFGSRMVVVPNFVDPISDAALFSKLSDNAVVFTIVVLVWSLYFIGLVYAHRSDKRDECLVGPINLPENRPTHQASYEVVVITGARPNAGTTSNVFVQMTGLFGQSTARQLHHPWRPLFQRNAVDTFYMTMPSSLGPLQRLRVWHDHADDSADATWFLKRIRVTDLQTGEMWYFPCSRWLALELDDGQVERNLDAVPIESMRNFKTAFNDQVSNGFSDGHLWLSVFSRPPQSRFTRKQRLTCVLCLLLLTMLTSILFYRQDESKLTFEQEVFVAAVSLLIIFPVVFIYITLFRLSRNSNAPSSAPMDPLTQRASDNSLSPSSVNLSMHRSSAPSPHPFINNVPATKETTETDLWANLFKLQNVRKDDPLHQSKPELRETHEGHHNDGHGDADDDDDYSDDENSQKEHDDVDAPKFSLPSWVRPLTWLLIMFTNIFVSYWVILFGLSFGASTSWSWLRSLLFAIFTSICVLQPLEVLFIALVIAYIYKTHDDRERPDDELDNDDEKLEARNTGLAAQMRRRRRQYRPRRHRRTPADVRLRRARRLQELKMYKLLKEVLLYLFFVWMLAVVIYADYDQEVPRFADAIRNTFSAGDTTQYINSSRTVNLMTNVSFDDEWWNWLEDAFLPQLYWESNYNNAPTNTNAFIHDGDIALVGGVQVRQLRVRSNTCSVAREMVSVVSDCYNEWSSSNNDDSVLYLKFANGSSNTNGSSWSYRSESEVGMHMYFGDLVTYSGGGYTQLFPDKYSAAKSLFQQMRDGLWTDRHTRAVFSELTLYSANSNLFAAVQFVAEFTPTGDVVPTILVLPVRLYRYIGRQGTFLMASEIMFLIVLIYYTVVEVSKLRHLGWDYFGAYRNWLELIILSLSHFFVGFDIYRIVFVEQSMHDFVNAGRSQFAAEFHTLAYWDRTVRILQAVLLFFATLKFIVLLRHNTTFNLLARVLQQAMLFLRSFLVVVIVLWLAFVIWGHTAFGDEVFGFSTVPNSMYTLLRLSLGDFRFDDFQDSNRVLGPLFFMLYGVLFYVIVANMFIAVMTEAIWVVKQRPDPDTGLTLGQYILDRIRWYTGLTLGRPQTRRKESVGAMCDEALNKVRDIESRLEALLRASPPTTNVPSTVPSTVPSAMPSPNVAVRALKRNKSTKSNGNGKSKLSRAPLPKPNDSHVLRVFGRSDTMDSTLSAGPAAGSSAGTAQTTLNRNPGTTTSTSSSSNANRAMFDNAEL